MDFRTTEATAFFVSLVSFVAQKDNAIPSKERV
jgi:hypothetical protein